MASFRDITLVKENMKLDESGNDSFDCNSIHLDSDMIERLFFFFFLFKSVALAG